MPIFDDEGWIDVNEDSINPDHIIRVRWDDPHAYKGAPGPIEDLKLWIYTTDGERIEASYDVGIYVIEQLFGDHRAEEEKLFLQQKRKP